MKITWRRALVIVCIAFGLLDNACVFDSNPNCHVITHYSQAKGLCNEDILHYFTEMPLGNNWLKLDSLPNGKYLNFKSLTATNTLKVAKGDFNIYLDVYFTEVKKGSTCTECPTQVKLVNRSCFYKIDNQTIITLKSNREMTKSPNYSEMDWPEYIEISTYENGDLNHIPGVEDEKFKDNILLPTYTIGNKIYTNVIHVYDSTVLNNSQ